MNQYIQESQNMADSVPDETYKKLPEYTEMYMRVEGLSENEAVEAAYKLCESFAKWGEIK